MKEWEWLAMMLSGLWMFDNEQIQDTAHAHMNECDAATASGVIKSLSPAREKELRKDTALTVNDHGYSTANEDWVRMFQMGPRKVGALAWK